MDYGSLHRYGMFDLSAIPPGRPADAPGEDHQSLRHMQWEHGQQKQIIFSLVIEFVQQGSALADVL